MTIKSKGQYHDHDHEHDVILWWWYRIGLRMVYSRCM